jgi:hypothetical protein
MAIQCYRIHDFVDIEIKNGVDRRVLDSIEFQIGHFQTDSSVDTPHIVVKPFEEWLTKESGTQFHRYWGENRNYLENSAAKMAIETNDGGFIIYTGRTGFLINIYIQILLCMNSSTFIHAAGITGPDGDAVAFAGGGGVGKTSLSSSLVRHEGYRWLGDDLVILDKTGICYSYPRSFVLKDYHHDIYTDYFDRNNLATKSRVSTLQSRVIRFAYNNAPFVGLFESLLQYLEIYDEAYSQMGQLANDQYVATPAMEDLFGPEEIDKSGTLSKLVFIERYSGDSFRINPLSTESLTNRLLAIIHHEWVSYMREFYTLGALEMFDISRYFSTVSQIIQQAIENSDNYLFRIPEQSSPDKTCTAYKNHFY